MEPTEHDGHEHTVARLVRHPLRAHLFRRYTEAETSPRAVAAALGEPLNVVSYHTQVLRRAGVIELVRTEPRRGAREHFYRAVLPHVIEDADWAELPTGLRRVLTRRVIDGVPQEAADALQHGGMDSPTVHLSRSYFALDDRGRRDLASLLRSTYESARDIGEASRARASDDAVSWELVIMSFERASSP
jgi:DNA-binding transcriptional ArsR family regulator